MNANLGPWAYARLPASWRGVPFQVRDSEVRRGRRVAVHEYPMRDVVWVEDLGRASQITSFRGFIVGDAVDLHLRALIAAAETPGEGTMVHPALGVLTGSLLEFSARDSSEAGRVWVVEFVFIASGARSYPGVEDDSQGQVDDAADDADDAVEGNWLDDVGDALASGARDLADAAGAVIETAGYYAGLVQGAVADVSLVAGAAASLSGNFGRFSPGARLAALPGLTDAVAAVQLANVAAGGVGVLVDGFNDLVEQL